MDALNCYECGAESPRLTSVHNVTLKAITHPVTGKTFNGGPSVAVCDNCLRRAQGLGHFVMERP